MVTMVNSRMYHWQGNGCDFTRFDIAPKDQINIVKAFNDDVSIIAFTGSIWETQQDGRRYIELPANMILRDAGQVYSTTMRQVAATGAICREIRISPRRLAEIYAAADQELAPINFQSPVIEAPEVHEVFWLMHWLSEQNPCALEMATDTHRLLWRLSRRSGHPSLRRSRETSPQKIGRVADYIRAHFSDGVALQTLAEIAGCNPFVLLRQFRKKMGVTPHDYLAICRVNAARDLLKRGAPILETSFACGFSDQSHLTRCFKKHMGVTPGRFVTINRR